MTPLNYTKKVLKEFQHPTNIGEIKNPDGHGMVGNPSCGDVMEVFLRIRNNKIIDIKAKTFGCIAAIATTSVLTKMVKGRTVEQAMRIKKEDIIKKLGAMPPIKIHCSLLGLNALHKAIEDYKKKKKEEKNNEQEKKNRREKNRREATPGAKRKTKRNVK